MLNYGFCYPGHITRASNLTGGVELQSLDIFVRSRHDPNAPYGLLRVDCVRSASIVETTTSEAAQSSADASERSTDDLDDKRFESQQPIHSNVL